MTKRDSRFRGNERVKSGAKHEHVRWTCESDERCEPKRVAMGKRIKKSRPEGRLFKFDDVIEEVPTNALGRPGSDLLSQGLSHSTISAEEFNGRVRDGIGFYLFAKTTRPAKRVCVYENLVFSVFFIVASRRRWILGSSPRMTTCYLEQCRRFVRCCILA